MAELGLKLQKADGVGGEGRAGGFRSFRVYGLICSVLGF